LVTARGHREGNLNVEVHMTHRRHGIAALAALLLVGALVAGCGGNRLAEAHPDQVGVDSKSKTITIGATAAKTGSSAAFYESSLGAQAMVAQLNAKGGINGWKLKYVVVDDGYEPNRAVSGVKQLVEQDKVFALVSMFGTPSNAATMPYVVQHQVPDVGFAMQTGIVARKYPDAKNLFGYIPPYANLAAFVVHYLAQSHTAAVSIAYQDDDSGKGAQAGLQAQAKAENMKVGVEVPVPTSATAFAGYAGRLAAARAPAVLLWMPPALAAGLIKACAAVGYKPKWVAPFFAPVPSFFDALGPLAEGVEFESWLEPLDSGSTGMGQFLAAMKQHTPVKNPSINAELGWIGMGIFAAGLAKATEGGRTPSRESVMQALNSGETFHPGELTMTVSYGGESRVPGAVQDRILRYQDGRLQVVFGPAEGIALPVQLLR
jgi:branched-chain amino acid transport system substrate-binding protein